MPSVADEIFHGAPENVYREEAFWVAILFLLQLDFFSFKIQILCKPPHYVQAAFC